MNNREAINDLEYVKAHIREIHKESFDMAIQVLKDLVHCGECKHLSDGRFCTVHSCHPTESDYCSWGEKK